MFFSFASVHRPCHGVGMVWLPRTSVQPHWGASPPARAACWEQRKHHTEGLTGGTALSLQRRLLLSVSTLFPTLFPYKAGQAGSWQARSRQHLALAQEFRGGVMAPPSPRWGQALGLLPAHSSLSRRKSLLSCTDSRLLFNVRLWPLARKGGWLFCLPCTAMQTSGEVAVSRSPP